ENHSPGNGCKHPFRLQPKNISEGDANQRGTEGAEQRIGGKAAKTHPRCACGKPGKVAYAGEEVTKHKRPSPKLREELTHDFESLVADPEPAKKEARHAAESIARHDAAHRPENRNAHRRTKTEHVFEHEVAAEEQQELVGNRQPHDSEN